MSAITLPAKANEHPQMRPLSVLRDLSTVADLIELCFSPTMDNEGQRYLSDMRRAGRDEGFLRWANHMAETTSLPLTGFVWEENNCIVGNSSLIPFRDKGKRVHLIANVAVHPDHRRRGIARLLTERTLHHARQKKTTAIWLHVRDDNPGAIKLYADLGFQEVARRTAWTAAHDPLLPPPSDSDIQIVSRHPRFWPQQGDWLRRLYPDALAWYHSWSFNSLKPGFLNWLYLLLNDFNIQQWAAVRGETLLAALTWMPQGGRSDPLYAAVPGRVAEGIHLHQPQVQVSRPGERSEPEALTRLLLHARRVLPGRPNLSLDYPAGEMTEAISAAGFNPRRTLIWMRA